MKKILICILCLLTLCCCQQEKVSDDENNENQVEEIKTFENNVVVLENNKILKPDEQIADIDKYLKNYDTLEVESSAVFYSNDDIEIFVGGDGKVKKITLFTDKYKLDNNIKVGSTLEEMEKLYNNETKNDISDISQSYSIDETNVTFSIKNDKISQIELEINSYS